MFAFVFFYWLLLHLPQAIDRTAYRGPTEPMDAVIQQINQNNFRIPTLWTQLNFNATFVNPQKKTTDSASGDGSLLYRRPASLLLTVIKMSWVRFSRSVVTTVNSGSNCDAMPTLLIIGGGITPTLANPVASRSPSARTWFFRCLASVCIQRIFCKTPCR